MPVKERLIIFLKSIRVSQSKFAKTIGVSTGYVNAIRVSIQPDKIYSITTNYPKLNINWLLTGEGKMLKDDVVNSDVMIIDDDSGDSTIRDIDIEDKIVAYQKRIVLLEMEIDQLKQTISDKEKVIKLYEQMLASK